MGVKCGVPPLVVDDTCTCRHLSGAVMATNVYFKRKLTVFRFIQGNKGLIVIFFAGRFTRSMIFCGTKFFGSWSNSLTKESGNFNQGSSEFIKLKHSLSTESPEIFTMRI